MCMFVGNSKLYFLQHKLFLLKVWHIWRIELGSIIFLLDILHLVHFPAGIYLFKVNNRNSRTMCKICSKLTIKTPERGQWRFLVSLLSTLNRFHTLFWCFYWTSKCPLGSCHWSLSITPKNSRKPEVYKEIRGMKWVNRLK